MKPAPRFDCLTVWESGANRRSVEQGLLILDAWVEDESLDRLADLSISQRNCLLLSLSEQLLGASFEGVVSCPGCDVSVALDVDLVALRRFASEVVPAGPAELDVGEVRVRFRAPTSRDLAAVARDTAVKSLRHELLARCIHASNNGRDIPVEDLPDSVLDQVSEALFAREPMAETRLQAACPDCGHVWSTRFDIVEALWVAIERRARRSMREVHALARAYGWREQDVLSMSPVRRQNYLTMLMS